MPTDDEYRSIEGQADKRFWTDMEIGLWRGLKYAGIVGVGVAAFSFGALGALAWPVVLGCAALSAFSFIKEKKTIEEYYILGDAIAAKNSAEYLGRAMREPEPEISPAHENERGARAGESMHFAGGESRDTSSHQLTDDKLYEQNQRQRPGSYTGDIEKRQVNQELQTSQGRG